MSIRLALVILTLLVWMDVCFSAGKAGQKSGQKSGQKADAKSAKKCKGTEFRCRSSGLCIDKLLTCDGNVDCVDESDEKANCKDTCRVNGSVVVDSGVTTQDDDWWYSCSRSRWRAAGCVINNRRYAVGQTFSGFQNDFWGKCEKLGPHFLRRHLYGCVDYKGRLIDPGEIYLIDSLFWANCSSHESSSTVTGLGDVTLNGVRRQIIGCNDGTDEIVPNNEEFLEIGDESSGLGVALQCKLSGEEAWPQVVPVACIIGNESNKNEFIGLSNGCYEIFGSTVYFCTIAGKVDVNRLDNNRLNGTWRYNWQLSWNASSDETVNDLESKGFIRCPAESEDEPEKASQKIGKKKESKIDVQLRIRRGIVPRKRRSVPNTERYIHAGHRRIFSSVAEERFLVAVKDAVSNISPL